MRRIFLDANIFFAGARSAEGGSYFILELAKRQKIEVCTVLYALQEAERNIKQKLGHDYLLKHYDNVLGVRPVLVSLDFPSYDLMATELRTILPEKDIPILTGAFISGAEALITLDKKHFLSNRAFKRKNFSFEICTPGDYIQKNFL